MTVEMKNRVQELLEQKTRKIDAGEETIYLVGPVRLPIQLDGETVIFQWYNWLKLKGEVENFQELLVQLPSLQLADAQQSSVLVYGDFEQAEEALVRMHSICHTGDIFGSKRCDCGFQLKQALRNIVKHGTGAVFYLANHEGRGIGLFSKAMAYVLQENGYDTVDANIQLGFSDDERNYEEAIAVLRALRSKPITLMTNNPNKIRALEEKGMNVAGRAPLWGDVSEYNKNYLQTKVERSGHLSEGGTILHVKS